MVLGNTLYNNNQYKSFNMLVLITIQVLDIHIQAAFTCSLLLYKYVHRSLFTFSNINYERNITRSYRVSLYSI